MKRVKGCLNSKCIEYKETYYKEDDEYCVKCGTRLSYVCKHPKCFKQMPEEIAEKYCPIHLAERQDRKEKRDNAIKKVGNGILAFSCLVITAGKSTLDMIKRNK